MGFNAQCLNNKATFTNCTFVYGDSELNSLYYDQGTNDSLVVDGVEQVIHWTADVTGLTLDTENNTASGTVKLTPDTDETFSITISISECDVSPWSKGNDYLSTFEFAGKTFSFDLDISSEYSDGYFIYLS